MLKRQGQGMEQQLGRSGRGVIAAVAEKKLGGVEMADGKAHQVAQGGEFVACVFKHGQSGRVNGKWKMVCSP